MALSVVIPVLNGARTLPECLEALRVALPEAAEIVVVDDGSTDETAAVASRHARVISHGVNRGTSAARNTGWRATSGDRVLFLDCDVVVRPDAVRRLLDALDAHPDALGANAALSLDRLGDPISDFANVSIHYQQLRHGRRVASAFTSLCVLKREALERMGGWDERWHGRYADDVVTRYLLPPGSLVAVPEAQARHEKRMPLRGLLRHRFWIGWFFVKSALAHRQQLAERPKLAVLALRYPINTALAAATLPALAAPEALGVVTLGWVANNLAFGAFVRRHYGSPFALGAMLLSVPEAFAMLGGMIAGTLWKR